VAERKAIADAQKIIATWNARQAGGREPFVVDDEIISADFSRLNPERHPHRRVA
jgi:catalase